MSVLFIGEVENIDDINLLFKECDFSLEGGFNVFESKHYDTVVIDSGLPDLFIELESISQARPEKTSKISLNPKNRCAYIKEKKINLRNKEYLLLKFFIENKNKIVTEPQILDSVWNDYSYILSNTVAVHVKGLRRKLGKKIIKTYKNAGYQFKG